MNASLFVLKNGLRWRDAPPAYGPHKTIYNRLIRWSRLSVFNRIFAELAAKGGKPAQKGALPRCIGRTKGGLNSKLHAVTDGQGRQVVMLRPTATSLRPVMTASASAQVPERPKKKNQPLDLEPHNWDITPNSQFSIAMTGNR